MNDNKNIALIGVVLVFLAPYLHLIHYVIPTGIDVEWLTYTLKDFAWLKLTHAEDGFITIGLILAYRFRPERIWWIAASPLGHMAIDMVLSSFSSDKYDLWIIHKYTLSSFAAFQIIIFGFWNYPEISERIVSYIKRL